MQMKIKQLIRIVLYSYLLLATSSVWAQGSSPLTLKRAVSIALERNPFRKMALADAASAQAGVTLSRSSFFPIVSVSETATVGNDPVYAFGTRLRQGRFTQADFAVNRLNFPTTIGNYATRIGGQWNIFDSLATTFEIKRAQSLQGAAQKQLSRADQQVVYQVIEAYNRVLLANRQLEVAEQSSATAQEMVRASSSRVEAGTAVEADALSAKVTLARRQQERIRARSGLAISHAQLNAVLGLDLSKDQVPSGGMEARDLPETNLHESELQALEQRPDMQGARLQVAAQQYALKMAKSAFGPRVDVFGSWQADNSAFAGNGNNNWMTGAELRIDLPFKDKFAKLSMEKAGANKMEAALQAEEDNVRLEVRRAYYDHEAARQMLEVTRGSIAQAEESLRMIRDRYESGLATITDLLRAEDADRSARIDYWQSVSNYTITYAALQLACGDLNDHSPVVTQ